MPAVPVFTWYTSLGSDGVFTPGKVVPPTGSSAIRERR